MMTTLAAKNILVGSSGQGKGSIGQDVTHLYVHGARCTLEIAEIVGAKRAYLKGGSPSCDKDGVTGELLRRAGVRVIRIG